MAMQFAHLFVILATLCVAEVAPMTLDLWFPDAVWRWPRQTESEGRRPGGDDDAISPCPEVLSNIRVNRNRGRWTGLISVIPEVDTTGVVLDIQLDSPADLIGTSFGEVYSKDNILQTIRDDNLQVESGQMLGVRFFVKFNTANDPPRVRTIRLNGRQICPDGEDTPVEITTPSTTTQDVTFTSPPSPATIAPIDSGPQNGQIQETEGRRPGGDDDAISPCPEVLSNIRVNRNRGRWTGLISVIPEVDTTGVVLDIQLDSPADLIGTSFGEVYSKDNILQTIRDDNLQVESGQMLGVRFFVKFNTANDPPRVRTIRLNGRQICPDGEDTPVEITTPSTTTQDVTFTNPPSPATIAPIDSGRQNGQIQVIPTPAYVAPPRRPDTSPGDSSGRAVETELYEIKGEFKVYSNASLLVLLIARPPGSPLGEILKASQTDNLDNLLAQVYDTSSNTDGTTASSLLSTGAQVLKNENDDDEEEPPFTSNSQAAPPSPGLVPAVGIPGEVGGRASGDLEPQGWSSPCPGVFSYLSDSTTNSSWHGSLALASREHLVGVRLDLELDKPSRVLGAWLGDAKSADDVNFTIWNPLAEIRPGETILVRIFAKYDGEEDEPPRIKSIRFNGRQICPAG